MKHARRVILESRTDGVPDSDPMPNLRGMRLRDIHRDTKAILTVFTSDIAPTKKKQACRRFARAQRDRF
jgi:hypothetical protein